jgi:hypothetical protein
MELKNNSMKGESEKQDLHWQSFVTAVQVEIIGEACHSRGTFA